MDRLLTPKEVAGLAGISRGTVINRLNDGSLSFEMVDGNRRVPETTAVAFANTYDSPRAMPLGDPVIQVAARRETRYRVFARGDYPRGGSAILFTCKELATAKLMAAASGVPTRIAAVKV